MQADDECSFDVHSTHSINHVLSMLRSIVDEADGLTEVVPRVLDKQRLSAHLQRVRLMSSEGPRLEVTEISAPTGTEGVHAVLALLSGYFV